MNAPRPGWPFAPVAAIIAAAWAAFVWPWLSGRVTVPWDAKAHFYPQLVHLANALHAGTGFAWTPFVFSGSPQIADPQSLIFSPPHHLLARFVAAPGFAAFDAIPFVMLLIGALAVALYFRDRGWRPEGAVVAALAFALGGSAAWRIQHVGQIMSLAYFPIALLLLHRALARPSKLYGLALGLVGGALLLGRDQVAGLCALTLIAYGLTMLAQRRQAGGALGPALAPLIIAALVALAVIAIPVAMTAVMAQGSNRSFIDYDGAGRGSLHPAALLTAFLANVYGADGDFPQYWGPPSPLWGHLDLYIARNMSVVYSGALVALAVVFGAAGGGLWKAGARFFGVALLVAVLYTLGRYTPFFKAIYTTIPGIDFFRRPADGTFLIGALAAYAAGHVVHVLASGETGLVSRAGRIALSVSLAMVLSALALALAKGRLGYAWPMIAEGAAWLAVTAAAVPLILRRAGGRPMLAAGLFAALLGADLIRNNGPNDSTALPPAMYEALKPKTADATILNLQRLLAQNAAPGRLDRVELAAIDFHMPNASLVHGLHNVLGYNPLRSRAYSDAVGAGDHIALPDQRKFPPLFPGYDSPLANLLGLRYIATNLPGELDRALGSPRLPEVASNGDTRIFENPRALPRVMVVPRAETANFSEIIRTGRWPTTDFENVALFETLPPGGVQGARRGTARIVSYKNTEIVIEAEAPDGGYLVLNDPLAPWWWAYVDGYVAEMSRVNVLFRAVALPPGRFTVTFAYKPMRGLAVSATDWLSGRPAQP